MGNQCTSQSSVDTQKNNNTVIASQNSPLEGDIPKTSSISNLFRSLFKIASPVSRRIVSKILLNDYDIRCYEKPVGKYKQDQPDESLPIQPLEINFNDILVVDQRCISKEKKKYPDFEWPGQTLDAASNDLIVFDLIDFDCCIRLSRGIEIAIPIPTTLFGVTGKLEIGSNHKSIQEASVCIHIPKLRIWYVHGNEQTLYVSFWGRPDIIPNLHVNADFGKGDCFNMEFTEKGCLDDVVEKILSGFAPKDMFEQTSNNTNEKGSSKQSSMGNRIGGAIVQILSKFNNTGHGRPIAVELRDKLQPSVDKMLSDEKKTRTVREIRDELQPSVDKPLGKLSNANTNISDETKTRTAKEIKADIKLLEMELEQVNPISPSSINQKASSKKKGNGMSCFDIDSLCG